MNGIIGAGIVTVLLWPNTSPTSETSVPIFKLEETSVLSKRVQQVCVKFLHPIKRVSMVVK